MKKVYTPPCLMIHGTLTEITLNGSVENSDTPDGNNNTAYPPRS